MERRREAGPPSGRSRLSPAGAFPPQRAGPRPRRSPSPRAPPPGPRHLLPPGASPRLPRRLRRAARPAPPPVTQPSPPGPEPPPPSRPHPPIRNPPLSLGRAARRGSPSLPLRPGPPLVSAPSRYPSVPPGALTLRGCAGLAWLSGAGGAGSAPSDAAAEWCPAAHLPPLVFRGTARHSNPTRGARKPTPRLSPLAAAPVQTARSSASWRRNRT